MQIKDIDFPEALISAQQQNNLVIFAGAGVSIPSPSNYPDFTELAKLISSGTLEWNDKEPIDHFLGRLEKKGVDVHGRTKDLLSNPESKSGHLHNSILNLFKTSESVRLVTTNFDNHFTSLATTLFKNQNEIFYAPALPLGYDFSGIVYLHGCVEKNYKNLILTDRDFGRAYLTDGWATRFLQQLFQKYTVLFIGYSHNDLVLRYLSRGLPPDSINKRFALTNQSDIDFWNFLNITPVIYPHKPEGEHIALGIALNGWAEFSKMGFLDHKQKIQRIASSIPPVDLEEADYIAKDVLSDPVKTRFFIQYAKTIEWLLWLEGKEVFKAIFRSEINLTENSQLLASWFAQNFICEHTDEALAVIQRNGQTLNPALWYAIAHKINYTENLLPSKDLSKIICLLIQSGQNYSDTPLNYLHKKFRLPEDKISALLLFEYLSKPFLILRPSFGNKTEKIYPEISLAGDHYWIKDLWNEFFRPNLNLFAFEMQSVLTEHLKKAHYFLRAMNSADNNWDHISYGRPAIEPHSQNEFSSYGIGVLIDPARDVLEWLIENDNKSASIIIDLWYGSGIPILKRLAIHGIAENRKLNSDEKISWILERQLLYDVTSKHEVFRILQVSYSDASVPCRTELIQNIVVGDNSENKSEDEELERYRIYDLLVWLNRITPDCDLVKSKLDEIQILSPDFEPREYPDFNHYMNSATRQGPRSPITKEDLLKKKPYIELDWLLNFKGDRFYGPDRDGLLSTITEAISESLKWGWQLVSILKTRQHWDSDLWPSMFRAWQLQIKAGKNIDEELKFISKHCELFHIFYTSISELLLEYAENCKEISFKGILSAENIAQKILEISVTEPNEEDLKSEDWLTRAINHPGGKIALFWVHTLSRRTKETDRKEIPSNYKSFFENIVSSKSVFAMYGRVVLASQIHFLYSLDPAWTRKFVLPLFDWSSPLRSQQAWHGFVFWGRANEPILQDLIPLFEKSFIYLKTDLEEIRDRFCEHLASIAVYSSVNPLQHGWIKIFLKEIDLKDRETWAYYVGICIRSLNFENQQSLWEKWLKEYWKLRVSGVPLQLQPGETAKMVQWSVGLASVFSEVVDLICSSPAPKFEHTQIFNTFLEEDFVSKFPNDFAKLLVHILPGIHMSRYNDDLKKALGILEKSEIDKTVLGKIKNELARLGCEF